MKASRILLLLACAAGLSAQPKPISQPGATDPYMARWKAWIRQDLIQKHLVPSAGRPVLSDLKGVMDLLKPLLPDGKLLDDSVADDSQKSMRRIHIEALLDETTDYKFLRVWEVAVERWEHSSAAGERMGEMLSTPAVYRPGPRKGDAPGQICYSVGDGRPWADEVFLRENVVVAIHCMAPVEVQKTPLKPGQDRRSVMPDRTSVPGLCVELGAELGRIGEHIREALTRGASLRWNDAH